MECSKKKREVRSLLRKWKKKIGSKEEYNRGKKEYKELYERRKEGKREELLKEEKRRHKSKFGE